MTSATTRVAPRSVGVVGRVVLGGALVAAAGVLGALGGCAGASYTTPGAPADFAALGITRQEQTNMTDRAIAERMDRKPAASFPAAIAVARVQASDYSSYSYNDGAATGRAVVMTRRELPAEEAGLSTLMTQRMVRAVAPMNRMVAPDRLSTERDLRAAAAGLQCDMLLLYTFDTKFLASDNVPLVGLISLGLLPDRASRVRSTCSAILVDTRTGFVYALAEGTAQRSQVASAWSRSEAAEAARLAAENDALTQTIDQMVTAWGRVAATYGPSATAVGK